MRVIPRIGLPNGRRMRTGLRRTAGRLAARRDAEATYDEHRVLLDLGYEARAAADTDGLFAGIVRRVASALGATPAWLFVRDEETGRFACRAASPPTPAAERLSLDADAFVARRLAHLSLPLGIDAEEVEGWEAALAGSPDDVRAARAREADVLRQLRACLLVPVKARHDLVAILALGPRARGRRYGTADREMLAIAATQIAFAVENARLVERMVAEERLRRELALAAEVQRRLFPEAPPPHASADLAGFCQPARGVGGDYYDFLDLGCGRAGLAVADVSGKGMSAALVMSSVHASLRSRALAVRSAGADGSPSALACDLNRLLCGSTGPATYVTFFYAELDAAGRRLTYVNAGHNPPVLVRARGACERLDEGGPVVGMFEHFGFRQAEVGLEPGDLLVAYTDGVTEALDRAGEEFGEDRLLEALEGSGGRAASAVRDSVVERLGQWCAGAPQHDDLTFVVMRAI